MAFYIYARVSTFEQYTNGHSIEAQCEAALRYVKLHNGILGTETNCGLPGVFVDGGKSAFKKTLMQRAGGSRLMTALKPGDTVVATATHRLFRRMADMVNTAEFWVQQGINLRFVDYPMLNMDTANGKAMLYIFSVIAQMKSELMSARVKEAHAIRKNTKKAASIPSPDVSIPVHIPAELECSLGAILQEIVRERQEKPVKSSGVVRAYIRVSTKDQTVEQQQLMINRYLPPHLKQSEIVWYDDVGESAFRTSLTKRKSGGKMLADLQAGDVVVVWRTDRIFRSLVDMANMIEVIHRAGAHIHVVEGDLRTDSPVGNMMVSMITLMAEVESQDISRSTRQGQFKALATDKKMQASRLPKMFKGMTADHHLQKHFGFHKFFSREDVLLMHQQFYLTSKQFRDRRTAARVISNQWLERKHLPTITGEVGTTLGIYKAALVRMQKQEFSERRDAVLRALEKYPKDAIVSYPIDINTIARVDTVMRRFLRVAKKFKGKIADKSILVSLAAACVDPDKCVDLMDAVR